MKNRILLASFIFILQYSNVLAEKTFCINGHVCDKTTGSPVSDVNITVTNTDIGTTTDQKGNFSLCLNDSSIILLISHIGYRQQVFVIKPSHVEEKIFLNCELEPVVLELNKVEVAAPTPEFSTSFIEAAKIRMMTAPLPDPMLALKTLPGVSSTNDQTSFYNVRGGNYDENLIYINGFEIQQLQLVRNGYMENPSLINPLMLQSINLKSGAFPVNYGDKLSSVLDVVYAPLQTGVHGAVSVSSTGLTSSLSWQKKDKFAILSGFRKIDYGYLMHNMPLKGEYRPNYVDYQIAASYRFSPEISVDAIFLSADSKYNLEPSDWSYKSMSLGSFYMLFNASKQSFNFQTQMYGVRLNYNKKNTQYGLQISRFQHKEKDDTALDYLYLKGSITETDTAIAEFSNNLEWVDSRYDGNVANVHAFLRAKIKKTSVKAGLDLRWFNNTVQTAEFQSVEYPTDTVLYNIKDDFTLLRKKASEAAALYAEIRQPFGAANFRGGVRFLHTPFNGQLLALPRVSLFYLLNKKSFLFFSIGRYAQPPITKEIKSLQTTNTLYASTASTATVGGEFYFNKILFKVEAYYKQLKDLMSYQINDVRIIYSGRNDSIGRIYGLDFYLRWDQTQTISHWISFSYLKALEDLRGDACGWLPMPTDRRIQVSIFTEDRMEKFESSKLHMRALFGTGFPYTDGKYIYDPEQSIISLKTQQRNGSRLPFYMRFDVGFSQHISLFRNVRLVLREEVLNLFNHYNVLSIQRTPWNDFVKYAMSNRIYNLGILVEF